MRYQRIKTACYQVIPVVPWKVDTKKDQESHYKKLIGALTKVNSAYVNKGAGKKIKVDKETVYRDMPNVSIKLWKKAGIIRQYIQLPQHNDDLKDELFEAMQDDIGGQCKYNQTHLQIKNAHAFAIQGAPHLVLDLTKDHSAKLKSLFKLIGKKQQLLYSLTIKVCEDHNKKRKELQARMNGLDPDDMKSVILHTTKEAVTWFGKSLYDFWFEDKHQEIIDNWKRKGRFQGSSKKFPQSHRKLAEKNKYMIVQIMFLLWGASEEQAERFHKKLQRLLNRIRGENELTAVPVKPDLKRLEKGHIQYDLPNLCLYQKELSQFLYLPRIDKLENFHREYEQKTEPPEVAMHFELGGVSLGKRMDTEAVIAMPRATTETDLDDRGTPTLISGKKGSGKTQLLINQVADTFCFDANNLDEWQNKARSVVVFDVADGDMLREIYELVPDMLRDRVIVLNHADLDYPLPITNHDLLYISKIDGYEEEIADMETKILMDSLGDKNQTVAVERYFKMALQASYLAGDGNLIDAMRILEDASYRSNIIERLRNNHVNVFLPRELKKMDEIFQAAKDLEIIDNRISRLKSTQPWIDALAQKPTKGLNFWKWINGDKAGAYLVLIYIPKRINKSFRSFLFAHYFAKLWYMTEAREIINKADRKEFLIIVDELHQIFGHRVVPPILEAIYKEARKYRARYVFTIHGWSSIKDKAVKDAIKDASGNYIMLKGGDDMFSSLEKEFNPYTASDFHNLMKLSYTGLYKIDIKKKTHVFQAKLMDPASVRYKKQRSISLEALRQIKNKYGRPKKEVRASMINKEEISCCNKSLEEELEEITGENGSLKAN